MLKENKGVTLVALVITIIVLLILAGVSIAMVAGDNGVLNQAVNASVKTVGATARQDVETALTSVQTDFMAQKFENNLTAKFKSYINMKPAPEGSDTPVEGSILGYLDSDAYKADKWKIDGDNLTFDVLYKGTTFHVDCTFTRNGTGIKLNKFYTGTPANGSTAASDDYMEF